MQKFCRLGPLCGLAILIGHAGSAQGLTINEINIRGDAVPGIAGSTYGDFAVPAINDNDVVVFRATRTAGNTSTGVIGTSVPSAIDLGTAVPGTAGITLSSFGGNGGEPVVNSTGEIIVTSGLAGPGISGGSTGNDSAVLNISTGIIAQEGSPAPGIGQTFGQFGQPVLNGSDDVAYLAQLRPSLNRAIFNASGVVAQEGTAAPGAGGDLYDALGNVSQSSGGDLGFYGTLTGPGVTPGTESGVFTDAGLVVREGGAVPGIAGATFTSFGIASTFSRPDINDSGELAYLATIAGPGINGTNDSAIFSSTGGLIAREGDAAPVPGGGFFVGGGGSSVFSNPLIDDQGRIVFSAVTNPPGFGPRTGLFLYDGTMLSLLVLGGETYDVGGGQSRTFNSVGFQIRPEGLNDTGTLAFQANTADGPGVYAVSLSGSAAVPLPASLPLLLAGLGALGLWRRRGRRR